MEKLYLIIFFIFGSVMGSFYHVIATRLSNGLSIVKPASHCDKCKHILKWYELIPIISYLIQKGKCRECKTPLPISYFLMEICTGILFAVCYHVFDTPIEIAISILFVSSLITIIISDIEYMIILDEVLIFGIIGIIILNIIEISITSGIVIGLYQTSIKVLSGIGAFATMLLIKKLGDFLFKQESLGGGDIKLMFLIGLVCWVIAVFIAFIVSHLVINSDFESKRKKENIFVRWFGYHLLKGIYKDTARRNKILLKEYKKMIDKGVLWVL
jgi:prepilin signal peptidase PulO-like enzyme (type II secretory pathway)